MFEKSFAALHSAFITAVTMMMGKDATPSNLVDLRGFGSDRVGRRHLGQTKKGPGRAHYQHSHGSQRLRPAVHGGNWQGQEYLTYMEHDAITRSYLAMPSIPRDDPFHLAIVCRGRPANKPKAK